MINEHKRLNISAGIASATVALILVALKLWAYGQTDALSVAASLADSSLDLMMSLGALVAIWYASRPADEEHAFGHSAAEDLTALGQGLFVLVSAGVICWAAVARLLSDKPAQITSHNHGIAILTISIVLTIALVIWQSRVAKRTNNAIIRADRLHYLGDLLPNIGAIIALFAAQKWGLFNLDSIVAIGAAIFLAIGALRIFKRAWDGLMDHSIDPDMLHGIQEITRNHPGIRGFHDLKTRCSGSVDFVTMHIELDGWLSLDSAHAIAASLRRKILHAYPHSDVMLHQDPVNVTPHPDDPKRR